MIQKYFLRIFIVMIGVLPSIKIQAQITIASDKASNYATWTNTSNAGTGFTSWDLWTQNTNASNFAGHFLGDSNAQGFGNINSIGTAFGMYGNPQGAFPQANAQRFLNNTGSSQVAGRSFLLPGQSFKIDLAIAYRNGYKGIDLLDQNFTPLFNFNVGNDIYSTSNNADLGWTYSQNSIFQLEVQQTDTNTYVVIITRGADVYNSGNRTGQFSGVKLYVGNTQGGNDLNNFFFNNMELQRCAVTTTWDGTSWNNGLPTIDKSVIFTGNYTSTGDVAACSVSVINGAQVTVAGGHTFTIENNINIASGSNLIFENNASLLQTNASATNSGSINYKRNATPMRQFEYTYWGSPVSNQTLFGFSPLTNPARYYSFDANPTVNDYVAVNSSNTMIPGNGYVIRSPDNYTASQQIYNGEFIGIPNNGNYSVPVFAYDLAVKNSNLIGNPYPSAISVAALYATNPNLGTLYYWTHKTAIANNVFTSNDYAIRTQTSGTAAYLGDPIPGDYIAAGQGFFASFGTNGSINFNNTMRVANSNAQFFKNTQNPQAIPLNYYFWLNMTNSGGAFKQMSLGYQDNATNGYDFGIDALATPGQFINFYSLIGTNSFAIQGRAYPWNVNDIVPLGYSSTIAGSFDISIDHLDTFFTNQDIYLEDTTLNTYHNLKNGPYSFTTAIGTFDARFKIHYFNPSLSNNTYEIDSNLVFVTIKNKQIALNTTSKNIKSVQVYNALGQLLFETKNITGNSFSIDTIVSQNQALILKIGLEDNQIITKKVIF